MLEAILLVKAICEGAVDDAEGDDVTLPDAVIVDVGEDFAGDILLEDVGYSEELLLGLNVAIVELLLGLDVAIIELLLDEGVGISIPATKLSPPVTKDAGPFLK